uniref:Uncharacterized protein n=1 Tax=Heterorhabditis bacteriophora TaxID=37862 RepID=A0A1I7WZ34_HETBA
MRNQASRPGSIPLRDLEVSPFLSSSSCQTRPRDNCSTIAIQNKLLLFVKRIADDRANGKFRCTWTESLRTARDGFLEPGL